VGSQTTSAPVSQPRPSEPVDTPAIVEPPEEFPEPGWNDGMDDPPDDVPAPAKPQLDKKLQDAILTELHRLDCSWHSDVARQRASTIIGRQVQPGEPLADLTEAEGKTLLAKLVQAVKRPAKKAGAAA
jgi:hypothetical protein